MEWLRNPEPPNDDEAKARYLKMKELHASGHDKPEPVKLIREVEDDRPVTLIDDSKK